MALPFPFDRPFQTDRMFLNSVIMNICGCWCIVSPLNIQCLLYTKQWRHICSTLRNNRPVSIEWLSHSYMTGHSIMTGCIWTFWYPIYVHVIMWYHTPRYSTYCIQINEAVFVVNYENHRPVIIEWIINAYMSGHSEMTGWIRSLGFSLYGQEFNMAP